MGFGPVWIVVGVGAQRISKTQEKKVMNEGNIRDSPKREKNLRKNAVQSGAGRDGSTKGGSYLELLRRFLCIYLRVFRGVTRSGVCSDSGGISGFYDLRGTAL